MNRYKIWITFVAFSMVMLSLPIVASAQWRGDRNDNNDNYGRNDVNLSYAIKNLRNNTRRFASMLDRELDRSRLDGTDREDRLNNFAKSLKDAADDLDDKYDSRGDLNRSRNEARRVLDAGSRLDRAMTTSRIGRNASLSNFWAGIERDLMTISRAYNYNYNGSYGRGNGRNNDDRRGNGRNDDDRRGNGRNDDDRRGNNGRNNRNLRGTISNLKGNAKRFENRVDREYDSSRNNRGRNDRRASYRTDLEDLSNRFKDAVEDLEKNYDNRGDYNRSSNEARQVLSLGQQISRAISRERVSSAIQSDWDRIERDLQVLAEAYNQNYSTNRRGSIWPF